MSSRSDRLLKAFWYSQLKDRSVGIVRESLTYTVEGEIQWSSIAAN